ncbi:MAG TPA: dockerin type I domain-containing protein, partial [Phycisphaerae bacterium]|nr:dockerin type I domain-containing protein [Phycisphaerae bacterium]
ALLVWGICRPCGATDVPPTERTADMPDSWLVLYDTNMPDSVTWANWYAAQWGIPPANLLGLDASPNEHLTTQASAEGQIIGPVRSLFDNNPSFEAHIMGILVGYGLPGHYATPLSGPPGGYFIPDALEDMYDDDLPPGPLSYGGQQGYNSHDNPQFQGLMLPPEGRPTKAWMEPHRYMVARIDAPTLAAAMAMTTRAKWISSPNHYIAGELLYYDYLDPALPSGRWQWLQWAVEEPALADLPWTPFDERTQQAPSDAMRFGTYGITGRTDQRLRSPDAGSRILAFDYDSWGATTVRSTTAEGGRFVPNAIDAGYAAAIGSTGEPGCCLGPCPETIFAALREGWTLGESFHIADVYDDWMWTLVGDPLLRVPHWFTQPRPAGTGDMNGDGVVNGLDVPLFMRVYIGDISDPDVIALADLNGDGVINDDDLFLLDAPILYQTNDPNVLRGNGDANGDRLIDGRDIGAFIEKLIDGLQGDESLREQFGPDMNKDGQITIDDLPLFVQVLLRQSSTVTWPQSTTSARTSGSGRAHGRAPRPFVKGEASSEQIRR